MPIKIFAADGILHMMRLDLENDGTPIEGWTPEMLTTEGNAGLERDLEARPLTGAEVAARYEKEKGLSTK